LLFQDREISVKRGVDMSEITKIRTLREKAGMTAFELAKESGVSLSTIHRMEKGKDAVSRRLVYPVLTALGKKHGRELTIEEFDDLKVR
jgi:transcriptional regulator with XRE-family HTH domain